MNIALGTYVQVLRSQTLHDNVKGLLAPSFPPERLSGVDTQVQPIENSSIITVVVQSPDAALAKSFATEMINQVIDDNPLPLFQLAYRVHILDSPNLPDRPVLPNKPVSLMLGAAGSLLVGLALAFLFDTWRRRRHLQRAQ
jgi:capsular polysaccharide biosynthesis protein